MGGSLEERGGSISTFSLPPLAVAGLGCQRGAGNHLTGLRRAFMANWSQEEVPLLVSGSQGFTDTRLFCSVSRFGQVSGTPSLIHERGGSLHSSVCTQTTHCTLSVCVGASLVVCSIVYYLTSSRATCASPFFHCFSVRKIEMIA